MMKYALPLVLLAGLAIGCGKEDAGDVEAAKKAAEAAPKTEAQLPKDMPPEAKRAAMGGMGAQQAMAQQQQQQQQARMSAGK